MEGHEQALLGSGDPPALCGPAGHISGRAVARMDASVQFQVRTATYSYI